MAGEWIMSSKTVTIIDGTIAEVAAAIDPSRALESADLHNTRQNLI